MGYKVGFIGTGNMGSALATAVSKAEKNLLLADVSEEKAKDLAQKIGCDYATNEKAVKECEFIFLGVKPQVLPLVLDSIKGTLKSRKDSFVLVSMAAGTKIETIISYLGFDCPIIRIMPNLPVSLGEGVILHAHNDFVSEKTVCEFEKMLSNAGKLIRMEEKMIDAGSAISGCGPAFVYMFIEALTDGGVACGLTFNQALELSAQTLIGASKMVLSTDKHPGKLRSDVCSPAGTTIEGVKALEQNGFRAAAMEAVTAAYNRTVELSEK